MGFQLFPETGFTLSLVISLASYELRIRVWRWLVKQTDRQILGSCYYLKWMKLKKSLTSHCFLLPWSKMSSMEWEQVLVIPKIYCQILEKYYQLWKKPLYEKYFMKYFKENILKLGLCLGLYRKVLYPCLHQFFFEIIIRVSREETL